MIASIQCIGIQGHVASTLELPRKGVVRIHGPNSAGKTALFKPLQDLINGSVSVTQERVDLINDNATEGIYTIEKYDGTTFSATLHEEPSKTEFTLTRPNGESFTRRLADKNLGRMISEIGFHYDEKSNRSLNMNAKKQPLLIVETSPAYNGELVQSAWIDLDAEAAKVSYLSIIEEAEAELRSITTALGSAMIRLQSLQDEIDIESEEAILKKLRTYANLLSCMLIPEIRSINVPPDIEMSIVSLDIPEQRSIVLFCEENIELMRLSIPTETPIKVPILPLYLMGIVKLFIPRSRKVYLPLNIGAELLRIKIPDPRDVKASLHRLTELEVAASENRCPVCNILIDEHNSIIHDVI